MSKTISAVMCEHGVIGGAPSSNLEERLAATILSLESKLEQAQAQNAELETELRPELGTFELCDKHYDASRTESEEHCAVCQLESKLEKARAKIVGTRDIFHQYLRKTKEVRLLCLKLEKENRQIMAENERLRERS